MRLVLDHDAEIAHWVAGQLGVVFYALRAAIGVIDGSGTLLGGAVLHSWSKHDMELSYYGPGTLSAGMVRMLAIIAFEDTPVSRVTIRVPKANKPMRLALPKFGFKFEGVQERLYGPRTRDDGILFGITAERAKRFLAASEGEREAA